MTKRPRQSRKLETVLNRASTPFFLLDARRRILFFNAGCAELTGWSANEVTGQVCDYARESDPAAIESLTGCLAPPPEVLAGREASVPTEILRRDGKQVTQMIHFFPLTGDEGKVVAVTGIMLPIGQPAQPSETPPARRLHAELAALRSGLRRRFGEGSLIGQSAAMRRAQRQIQLAAASRAGAMLLGEPGTGREHAARLIHFGGDLAGRSFVPLDCRRLPAIDLKLTLRRLVDAARESVSGGPATSLQPGTLFLANVEAMPRDLQQFVVEAVDSIESKAGGGLRLTASTATDVEQAFESETLVDEFYYRLTAIRIELPPLRERGEDLKLLAQAFLEERNRGNEKQIGGFSEDVWQQFADYNWPGNLDELSQVIAEARDECTGELIHRKDLPFRFRTGLDAQSVGPAVRPPEMPLAELLEKVEAEHIRAVLAQVRFNKTKAAELLGIPRARLYRRMQALGIEDAEEG